MYPVSSRYSELIRAPIRQAQGHARIYFGVFDDTARGDAAMEYPSEAPLSHSENVTADVATFGAYASLEGAYTRLDGTQALVPDEPALLRERGFLGEQIAGEGGVFSAPPRCGCVLGRITLWPV